MTSIDTADTIWRCGRFDGYGGPGRLLFGHMYEDWRIEQRVFDPSAPVFCIASAGCTSLALARAGYHVTAVDINPAQIEYLRRRMRGSVNEVGAAERVMKAGRLLLAAMGLPSRVISAFLNCPDIETQKAMFDRSISRRLHWALSALLKPMMIRRWYASSFTQTLPVRFADVLWDRLRRGFAHHLNRENEYAWKLILGVGSKNVVTESITGSLRAVYSDAAEYLETVSERSFGGFALSNILDAASDAYAVRLMRAVRRAARPDATFVLRSFAEPANDADRAWACTDRALIWGSVHVERINQSRVAVNIQPRKGECALCYTS